MGFLLEVLSRNQTWTRYRNICLSLTGLAAYGSYVFRAPLVAHGRREISAELLNDDSDLRTTVTHDEDMEFQFNETYPKITGTIRSDTSAYFINEFRQKSLSQIVSDLYSQPTVIAELSFIASGAIFSGLGIYFGRRRLRKAWFDRNFYNTINISLNSVNVNLQKTNPKYLSSVRVTVRTVAHAEIKELIPNSEGVKYLIRNATNHVKSHKIS